MKQVNEMLHELTGKLHELNAGCWMSLPRGAKRRPNQILGCWMIQNILQLPTGFATAADSNDASITHLASAINYRMAGRLSTRPICLATL
jgi:hypothetical protein